jgi:ABC-2 type transport system ATP-binding protein
VTAVTAPAAIHMDRVSRQFGSRLALDRVSLAVEPGEVFGYLGPNGAGKTTTVRILTGQLRPTSGVARIHGVDCATGHDRLAPLIGVVFEAQNVYERLSGRDNLTFAGRLYGCPRRRVDEVLALLDLSDRAGDLVSTYSNGMKQRLLIGRALLHEPRVLFLDEPTSGLDPHAARTIRDFIAGLPTQGVTVFLTTHTMPEAERLCHRVAIIEHGRIVALDTPANLTGQLGGAGLEDAFVALTVEGGLAESGDKS